VRKVGHTNPPGLAARSIPVLPSNSTCGLCPKYFSQKLKFARQVLSKPKPVLNEDIGCE